MSPWEGRYSPEPINAGSDLREQIREEATTAIRSQSLLGSLVPRSIPAAAVIRPFVTALPVSAEDGDEVRYLADASSGNVWHFRYRANAPSIYRWEFTGGSPLYDSIETREARSTNSYGDLATVGPTISIALPGEYLVSHGSEIMVGGSALTHGLMSYDVVGTSASDSWSISYVNSTVFHRGALMRTYLHGIAQAGDLVAKYKSSTANSVHFTYRWMSVTPIRVGRS